MIVRPIDPRIEDIVAKALEQRFTVDSCPECNGPRIYSKIRPEAKCMACGARTVMAAIKQTERRVRCDTCKKFFWSTILWKDCKPCKDRKAKNKAIDAKWSGSAKKPQ